jgi:hypothetical protein
LNVAESKAAKYGEADMIMRTRRKRGPSRRIVYLLDVVSRNPARFLSGSSACLNQFRKLPDPRAIRPRRYALC